MVPLSIFCASPQFHFFLFSRYSFLDFSEFSVQKSYVSPLPRIFFHLGFFLSGTVFRVDSFSSPKTPFFCSFDCHLLAPSHSMTVEPRLSGRFPFTLLGSDAPLP